MTSAEIQALIDKKTAQLTVLETVYSEAMIAQSEYRFDSGEGSQRTMMRPLKEISAEMTRLEAEIAGLNRKLSGTGLVNICLRRKVQWDY